MVGVNIEGICDPRFARVRDAFRDNFARRGEAGACLCVQVDGKSVVDLWGGLADPVEARPWERDTLVVVFSATKGAMAALALHLAARGELDPACPMARYWPEFGAAGKQDIPLLEVLSHRSGVAGVDEPIAASRMADWEEVIQSLARQAPLWEPGTAHGYHAVTFGFLVGETLRRITGQRPGALLQQRLAGPLGIDFRIGLPPSEAPRVARLRLPPPAKPGPLLRAMSERGSITRKAFVHLPALLGARHLNAPAALGLELPSSNGVTNARGLAGLYAPLAMGRLWQGVPLYDADALELATAELSRGEDLVLRTPTRFSAGFMKSLPAPGSYRFGPHEAAFGHVGAGGSFGFADPEARVSIGYAMNQMGQGVFLTERGQVLIDETYEALGA